MTCTSVQLIPRRAVFICQLKTDHCGSLSSFDPLLMWGVHQGSQNVSGEGRNADEHRAIWPAGHTTLHQGMAFTIRQEDRSLGSLNFSDGRVETVQNEVDLALCLGNSHNSLSVKLGPGSWAPPQMTWEVAREQAFPPIGLSLGPPQFNWSEVTKEQHPKQVSLTMASPEHSSMDVEGRGLVFFKAGTGKQASSYQGLSSSLSMGGDTLRASGFSVSDSWEGSCEMDLQLGLTRIPAAGESDNFISVSRTDHGGAVQGRSLDVVAGDEEALVSLDEGSTSARWIKSRDSLSSACVSGHMSLSRPQTFSRDTVADVAAAELNVISNGNTAAIPALSCDSLEGFSAGLSEERVVVGSSTVLQERSAKTCKFQGCGKGARGASGLCIAHGGGRRCQRPNCNKGAEGCTMYCKAHGGGRRCQHLGCIKSAEGKTDFCIAHGGGRRCNHEGCTKAARGKSGLCIRHGGGKRCQMEGCTKSAEGFLGLCISHGGGRRCQFAGCGKGAQGSTAFCKAHGGGRRCIFEGCSKGAEGRTPLCKAHGGGKRCKYGGGTCTKSVHGGTFFCVAHGGGKRCAVQGCSKSARGRTDFCVRHGGGKRCKFENCSKSAQGSTDFCKAHGGGKKCSRHHEGSTNASADKHLCDKFAPNKTGLCAAHNACVQNLATPWEGLCPVYRVPEFSSNGSEQFSVYSGEDQHFNTREANNVQSARSSMEGSCRSGSDYVESESVEVTGLQGFPCHVPGCTPVSCEVMSSLPLADSEVSRLACFTELQHMPQVSTCKPELSKATLLPNPWGTGPPQHDKLQLPPHHSLSSLVCKDMPCLSLPEGRVHGGGLMALLEKEAAKQRHPQ